MSGIVYGKTAEQAGLEFLSVLADPDAYKAKIVELKKNLEVTTAAQNKLAKQLNDTAVLEAAIAQHKEANEKALASARKINADTEDRRAEIARRQGDWENNLNVREAEVKKAEAEHAAEIKRFETYKVQKENELAGRTTTLLRREKEHESRKADLDARLAALEVKEKAAAELARVWGK